jgi:hypothetical protein
MCLRAQALTRAGDFGAGLAAIDDARRAYPGDADVLVYHACLYAYAAGRTDGTDSQSKWKATALISLAEVAEKQPDWFGYGSQFPELSSVRATPEFAAILAKLSKGRK